MRRFRSQDADFDTAFRAFLDERRGAPDDVDATVARVLEAVKADGIAAVLRFAREFDRAELTEETVR
ncbi:MAG TPA: histidinol dehydrogenase, partial [Caulobacteraceae bacterium]|nr:histidinol dehydrogenase [Caulobacteraceae bacterium]